MNDREWQPISTAPKDGRNIWVAYLSELDNIFQTEAWWAVSEWQTADGCCSIEGMVGFWMPLPANPEWPKWTQEMIDRAKEKGNELFKKFCQEARP